MSSITLTYGPVFMEYSLEESLYEDALRRHLTVYDDDSGEVEFVERDSCRIPTGLIGHVESWAKEQGLACHRVGWPKRRKRKVRPTSVPGITLYDYQVDAVQRAVDAERGVLELATGAGKSECAIALYLTLGKPRTLVVCPSIEGATGFAERFQRRGVSSVGVLGGGSYEASQTVTVAVIDSLWSGMKRNAPDILDLLRDVECLVADEVHHQATSRVWQCVGAAVQARYRYGLSGTPYRDAESRRGLTLHPCDAWLTAYTGPSLVHLSPRDLQASGHLTPCEYIEIPVDAQRVSLGRNPEWAALETRAVVQCFERNLTIANVIANLVDEQRIPFVAISRLEHGRILQRLLYAWGYSSICAYGGQTHIVPASAGYDGVPLPDDPEFVNVVKMTVGTAVQRERVLIGSSRFDESADIPHLTDLVNAGGGKASQRWRQKIGRILRRSPGKTMARVWDFRDEHNYSLKNQARKRRGIVRGEGYHRVVDTLSGRVRYGAKEVQGIVRRRKVKEKDLMVTVGMTVPVASAQFYMLRPEVSLSGQLEEGDVLEECYEVLAKRAMGLFFKHLDRLAHHAETIHQHGIREAVKAAVVQTVGPKYWVLHANGTRNLLTPAEVQQLMTTGESLQIALEGESQWRSPEYYGLVP